MIDKKPSAENPVAVIKVSYGNQGIAELEDGKQIDVVYRRRVGRPLCGDHVELQVPETGATMVSKILPSRNVFFRADRKQRKQAVASNLDRVVIVIAPQPAPSTDLVERYLVAVHSLGIEPILLINKSELLPELATNEAPAFDHLDDYRKLGYRVVAVSCKTEPGVSALIPELRGLTSILVGQSGVGKSSLANELIPDLELQTGALSRSTGKGTHTTTTTIMYSLSAGGRLIDSPGVWEYGLWHIAAEELAAGFREFSPYLGGCRFNNCRHNGEPSCAIANAVAEGEILQWRFESYKRLLDQNPATPTKF